MSFGPACPVRAQPASAANWYVTNLGLPAGDSICVATGINANGQIVGYAGQGGPSAPYELQEQVEACGGGTAFTWGAGTMTTLPTTMNVGGTQVPLNCAIGLGINSAGAVAGTVGYNDPVSGAITGAAAVYSGGQWNSLGGGSGQANWISNDGQTIAGGTGQGGSAFVVTGGVGGTLSQINGSQAIAYAGNSSGMIVGGLNYGLPTDSGGTLPWYYTGAGEAHTVDPVAHRRVQPQRRRRVLRYQQQRADGGRRSATMSRQVSAIYSLTSGWNDLSYNIGYARGHGIAESQGSAAYGCELGAFGITDSGDIVGADGFKSEQVQRRGGHPVGSARLLGRCGLLADPGRSQLVYPLDLRLAAGRRQRRGDRGRAGPRRRGLDRRLRFARRRDAGVPADADPVAAFRRRQRRRPGRYQRPDDRAGELWPDRRDLVPGRVHRRRHRGHQRPDDRIGELQLRHGRVPRRTGRGARTGRAWPCSGRAWRGCWRGAGGNTGRRGRA